MQAPEQIDLFEMHRPLVEHAEGGKPEKHRDRTPPGEHWKLVELPDAEAGIGFVRFPEGWRCVEVVLVEQPENAVLFRDLKKRGGAMLGTDLSDPGQPPRAEKRPPARQARYRGHAMGWEERFRVAQYRPPPKARDVKTAAELIAELDPEAEPWISSLR